MQVLQIGQPVQEQDALDQHIGMFHLADGFGVDDLAQMYQPPVLEHPGVKEILVDRCQLVGEHRVQEPDDVAIALHGGSFRRPAARA